MNDSECNLQCDKGWARVFLAKGEIESCRTAGWWKKTIKIAKQTPAWGGRTRYSVKKSQLVPAQREGIFWNSKYQKKRPERENWANRDVKPWMKVLNVKRYLDCELRYCITSLFAIFAPPSFHSSPLQKPESQSQPNLTLLTQRNQHSAPAENDLQKNARTRLAKWISKF